MLNAGAQFENSVYAFAKVGVGISGAAAKPGLWGNRPGPMYLVSMAVPVSGFYWFVRKSAGRNF